MGSNFEVGDLVWVRSPNNPAWPSQIATPPEKAEKGKLYVFYFGTKPPKQYDWVLPTAVTWYENDSKADLIQASVKADFKLAVEEAEAESQKKKMNMSNASEDEAPAVSRSENTKLKGSKRIPQPKKKFAIETVASGSSGPTLRAKLKRKSDSMENGTKPYKVKGTPEMKNNDFGLGIITDSTLSKPDFSTVDFGTEDELMAPTKTVGFLGLGIMSTGMVNNLIKNGHKVNLWNRNDEKCKAFKEKADQIKEGRVKVCMVPSDVVKESDIIFSCSSDPQSAEKVVSENCGVIYRLESLDKKGYVEMTGIDPHTSTRISDIIQEKGGRYLEAQLQGSREEAENGSLVLLTAGDNSLFMECQSCFKAIGKSSIYLGEVGVATKVQLILQLMQGISLVGLAEGLVLADRCGISGDDLIKIFKMTNMASPYLAKKANKIINKDFKQVEQSIKTMQKDIRLALGMSDELMQPLMMGSAANEVFKHSRKLGYDDHDCSCIYMKARF